MEAVRNRSDVLVSDAVDVWTQVTLSLRSQLAESVWFSTFQDVTPLDSDDDDAAAAWPRVPTFATEF